MLAAGYVSAIIMGLVLGAIGGGGSILTVPILVYLFKINPTEATGYSLFIVGSTASVGMLKNLRNHQVQFKTGLLFAIPGFLGVFLSRSVIMPAIPVHVLSFGGFSLSKNLLVMLAFATLMVLASLSMIRKKTASQTPEYQVPGKDQMVKMAVQGFLLGIVTGFVGAGGGFLIVPALVFVAGLNMRLAVGTSLMIIAINSLLGFLGELKRAPIANWNLLLSLALLAVIGIWMGTQISAKIPEQKLKHGFGWFVLVMGSVIIVDQISRIAQ